MLYVRASVRSCMRVFVRVCKCERTSVQYVRACARLCECENMHVCACARVRVYIGASVCLRAYIHVRALI